jgi:hypothetical protein
MRAEGLEPSTQGLKVLTAINDLLGDSIDALHVAQHSQSIIDAVPIILDRICRASPAQLQAILAAATAIVPAGEFGPQIAGNAPESPNPAKTKRKPSNQSNPA